MWHAAKGHCAKSRFFFAEDEGGGGQCSLLDDSKCVLGGWWTESVVVIGQILSLRNATLALYCTSGATDAKTVQRP